MNHVVATDLLGFLMNVDNSVIPATNVGSHEFINLGEELVPDGCGTNKSKHSTPHGLVLGTMYCCNVPLPHYIQH